MLWIACLGGLVALGCRELEEVLVAQFPDHKGIIHVGVIILFGFSFVQVALKPYFEELDKKLK